MAAKKTVAEQVQHKKDQIKAKQAKIKALQAEISTLNEDIENIQSMEVKAALKEIDIPFDEVVELLKSMKSNPIDTLNQNNKDVGE